MPTDHPIEPTTPPIIIAVGGLDPSGGAGLHADIKTITALQGHACALATVLTVQDSQQVYDLSDVPQEFMEQQMLTLMADMPPQAIKAGALSSDKTALWLAEWFEELEGQAFRVIDPVLKAGGGGNLSNQGLVATLRNALLPHTDLLTPNIQELLTLTDTNSEEAAIAVLLQLGVGNVLITGGHDDNARYIHNRLYTAEGQYQEWFISRLAGEFHGTGCTLASAVTTLRAHGLPLPLAIEQAQNWLTRCLQGAYRPGQGQWFLQTGHK